MSSSEDTNYNDGLSGVTMWGTYKGVRVGVIKTDGKIATVFPDVDQSSVLKKRGNQ